MRPTIDIQLHGVTRIEQRNCEYLERKWIEFDILDGAELRIATIVCWHPDNDKAPDVKVV